MSGEDREAAPMPVSSPELATSLFTIGCCFFTKVEYAEMTRNDRARAIKNLFSIK
jgi:hypothetical protein